MTNVELVDMGQRWDVNRVTFALADCWKGGLETTAIVSTPASDAACSIGFYVGTNWLVYGGGMPDALSANLCSRTQPLESATDDLAQLGTPTCMVRVTPSTWGAMKQHYRSP